jgi:hypothetical protein
VNASFGMCVLRRPAATSHRLQLLPWESDGRSRFSFWAALEPILAKLFTASRGPCSRIAATLPHRTAATSLFPFIEGYERGSPSPRGVFFLLLLVSLVSVDLSEKCCWRCSRWQSLLSCPDASTLPADGSFVPCRRTRSFVVVVS